MAREENSNRKKIWALIIALLAAALICVLGAAALGYEITFPWLNGDSASTAAADGSGSGAGDGNGDGVAGSGTTCFLSLICFTADADSEAQASDRDSADAGADADTEDGADADAEAEGDSEYTAEDCQLLEANADEDPDAELAAFCDEIQVGAQ